MNVPKWLVGVLVLIAFIITTNLILSIKTVDFLTDDPSSIQPSEEMVPLEPNYQQLITARYKVDHKLAKRVVETVDRYTDDSFPTKKDMLVLIGIESSFNPQAKSKLRKDAAVGLTQIRPKVWKHLIKDGDELKKVDAQVKYAVKILKSYYRIVGTKDGALLAYNNGLTNYMKGEFSTRYLDKFNKESSHYEDNFSKNKPTIHAELNGLGA